MQDLHCSTSYNCKEVEVSNVLEWRNGYIYTIAYSLLELCYEFGVNKAACDGESTTLNKVP